MRYFAVENEKRMKEGAGANPDRVRALESTAAKGKAIQAEYERKYGKRVVEILSKHEEQFLEMLQEQMVRALEQKAERK